jgi:hypothetical protein
MLLAGSLYGDVDRHPKPWKIDFTLSLAEKGGKWVFTVDGTTDLPAETVLRARVFVLNIVDDPINGPREDDDEALIRGDDPVRPSFVKFKAGTGKFSKDVYSFRKKPYSIRYRAKVFYLPHEQTDAITLKVGDIEFDRKADLRVGSDAAFEAELKAGRAEAMKDLIGIERLESDLVEQAAVAEANPKGWAAWKKTALAQVAEIRGRNEDRFDLWAVYYEYQTRFRVDGLCETVERIVRHVDDRDGAGERRWTEWFDHAIDEAYTVLLIDAPLDARRAKPAFAAYERAVSSLREGVDRPEVRRKARAEGVEALYGLLQMIRTRHRAYVHVNVLSVRLTRIFVLADAEASRDELKAALEAHDAALREFRAFAGVP